MKASNTEWAKATSKAKTKVMAAPPPAAGAIEKHRLMVERQQSRRGGDGRGSAPDRRRREVKLLSEFGDGRVCPCVICRDLLDRESITADRIWPGALGGSYRFENVVPTCWDCNQWRPETPMRLSDIGLRVGLARKVAATTYYHATSFDFSPGDVVLPVSETGVKPRFVPGHFSYDRNQVYITTSQSQAESYAWNGGKVYEVEPVGVVERDPETAGIVGWDVSYRTPRARVIRQVGARKVAVTAKLVAPGKKSIPSGHTRLFTRVGALGPGAPASVIAREGLRIDKARSYKDQFGDFRAIWSTIGSPDWEILSTTGCVVEFHAPTEEVQRLSGVLRDGATVAFGRDIPPSEFVAVYEQWHGIYWMLHEESGWDRAFMEDPKNDWYWVKTPDARSHPQAQWEKATAEFIKDLGVRRIGSKTAAQNRIYRGLRVRVPQDLATKVDELLAMPMEESEIGKSKGVAALIVPWLEKNHPNYDDYGGRKSLGRHWTTRKEMARGAAMQGGVGNMGIILEATYDPSGVDHEHTMAGHEVTWQNESEVTLLPGAKVTITDFWLIDWIGAGGVGAPPLIGAPIRAKASQRAASLPSGYTMGVTEETPYPNTPDYIKVTVVVKHQGQPVASLGCWKHDRFPGDTTFAAQDERRWRIYGIEVAADHQRKGIATAMWEEFHRRYPGEVHHSPPGYGQSADAQYLNRALREKFPRLHFGSMDRTASTKAEEATAWAQEWVSHHWRGNRRGEGACMAVSREIKDRYGWAVGEGWWIPDGEIDDAIRDNKWVFGHFWNEMPDGSIFDGSAGQFSQSGPLAKVVRQSDPEYDCYVSFKDVSNDMIEILDDIAQGSYAGMMFGAKMQTASRKVVVDGEAVDIDFDIVDNFARGVAAGLWESIPHQDYYDIESEWMRTRPELRVSYGGDKAKIERAWAQVAGTDRDVILTDSPEWYGIAGIGKNTRTGRPVLMFGKGMDRVGTLVHEAAHEFDLDRGNVHDRPFQEQMHSLLRSKVSFATATSYLKTMQQAFSDEYPEAHPAVAASKVAVGSFNPGPVSTPEQAFDHCAEVSASLAKHLRSQGKDARWVQLAGAPQQQLPPGSPWNTIPAKVRQHYVVLVDGDYIDYTARQFDADAPIPAKIDGKAWDREYDITDALDTIVTSKTAMPRDPNLVIRFEVEDLWSESYLEAYQYKGGRKGKMIGKMIWATDGEILHVRVEKGYRRRGVATRMLEEARRHDPLVHHSTFLTDKGRAWSEMVASKTAGLSVQTTEVIRSGFTFVTFFIEEPGADISEFDSERRRFFPEVFSSHPSLVAGLTCTWVPRIGLAHPGPDDLLKIAFIWTDSNHRGRGFADRLMDAAIAWARKRGGVIDHGERSQEGQNWWRSYAPTRGFGNDTLVHSTKTAMPTSWRPMTAVSFWDRYDACITTEGGGSGRRAYEVYIHGKQVASRATLHEAKAVVESAHGPCAWGVKRLPLVPTVHVTLGETTEFTSPQQVWVAELPRAKAKLGTVTSLVGAKA